MNKALLTAFALSILLVLLVGGLQTAQLVKANFIPYGTVTIISPANQTYNSNYLILNFIATFSASNTKTITYSVDSQPNVTITGLQYSGDVLWETTNGTLSLPYLSHGSHLLEMYAKTNSTTVLPNTGYAFVHFTINSTIECPTPTPTTSPNITPTLTPYTPTPQEKPCDSSPLTTQSPIELPWAAGNFTPTPNSTNIPLNTTISISFGRPPSICSLNLTPNVALKERVFRAEGYGGTYIFYLTEQLQPQTTYTVTITYGQETAQEDFKPTSTRTWQFTTMQINSPTQSITESPKKTPIASQQPAEKPQATDNPHFFDLGLAVAVVAVALLFVGIAVVLIRRRK